MPSTELKHHVELTPEILADILAAEGPNWIPICENEHSYTAYGEYLSESGGVLCFGCTFCRECEEELVGKECFNEKCKLYLRLGRAKDA